MEVTAIVADDEPLLRRYLCSALAEVWPELSIVGMAEDGQQAFQLIERLQPNIVFLDIRMPELDGMSLAQKLYEKNSNTIIVFTTAYDEYAVEAFEANAIDYLLKPLSKSRLMVACEKIKQHINHNSHYDYEKLLSQFKQLTLSQQQSTLKWIKAQYRDEIHLVAVKDVLYLKAEDKYVSVYQKNDSGLIECYLIRTPLKELLEQLPKDDFLQIHRSTVVNASKIDRVKKDFSGKMYVYIGDIRLLVSRSSQVLFKGM